MKKSLSPDASDKKPVLVWHTGKITKDNADKIDEAYFGFLNEKFEYECYRPSSSGLFVLSRYTPEKSTIVACFRTLDAARAYAEIHFRNEVSDRSTDA